MKPATKAVLLNLPLLLILAVGGVLGLASIIKTDPRVFWGIMVCLLVALLSGWGLSYLPNRSDK